MQTEFTAIAAPVRLLVPIYQSRRLCSFVDVILKTVEVFAPFTGCGMELSSSRGHAILAAISRPIAPRALLSIHRLRRTAFRQ
jgi:hypothetical protein